MRFNPRAREERDFDGVGEPVAPPRFNPRAREERDSLRLPCALHLVVSIHALAKSATGRDHGRFSRARGFNPRAREERDSTESSIVTWYSRFNPRAREERDRLRRLQD